MHPHLISLSLLPSLDSRASGWRANAAELFSATALHGPWRSEGNPTRDPTSFNSQSTYILPVTRAGGRLRFVYMADRFEPHIYGPLCGDRLCESGRYVWMPIEVLPPGGGDDDGALRVSWRSAWRLHDI